MPDGNRRQFRQLVYASRVFPGRTEQVRLVRRFVNSIVRHSPYADQVEQVSSELSANAIYHSRSGDPGGSFRLKVCLWDTGVYVMVIDQGGAEAPPATSRREPLAEHGRGLLLVSQLATRWAWAGDSAGRMVLAVFLSDHIE